jgi:ubiquinone/menaquinone biosynthesis C-methylase UbiE
MGSEFWNERVSKNGHTGYNDPIIYAYDQLARLKAIESISASLDCKREFALDFGTGTGDFANLLAKYLERVLAFDISEKVIDAAKKKYGHTPNVRFVNGQSITDIVTDNQMFDIILSVTVLDHIMNDAELERTIQWFQNNLSNKGYVVALESSALSQRNPSAYKRFSTMDEWLERFSNHGFSLETFYDFYDPQESPCRSYELYRNNSTVRFLERLSKARFVGRFARIGFASKHLEFIARSSIAEKVDFFWKDQDSKSPYHIMIFRKIGN